MFWPVSYQLMGPELASLSKHKHTHLHTHRNIHKSHHIDLGLLPPSSAQGTWLGTQYRCQTHTSARSRTHAHTNIGSSAQQRFSYMAQSRTLNCLYRRSSALLFRVQRQKWKGPFIKSSFSLLLMSGNCKWDIQKVRMYLSAAGHWFGSRQSESACLYKCSAGPE